MHSNLNKVRTLCPFNFVIEGTIFEAIAFSMQADSKAETPSGPSCQLPSFVSPQLNRVGPLASRGWIFNIMEAKWRQTTNNN